MPESINQKNKKYDELEQNEDSTANRIGSRKPVYMLYDAVGRFKRNADREIKKGCGGRNQ